MEQKNQKKTKKAGSGPRVRQPTLEGFHMITQPISANPIASDDQVLTAFPISPFIPLNNTMSEHQLSIRGANHAMYKFHKFSARLIPIAPDSVGGYSVSMVCWRDTAELPGKIDLQTLSQADHHVTSRPGKPAVVNIGVGPLNSTGNMKRCDPSAGELALARSGYFVVVLHGDPTNAYTGARYTGPLLQIEFQVLAEFTTWSPGNTDSKIKRSTANEAATLASQAGALEIKATSMNAFTNERATPSPANTIAQVALNIGDAVSSVLPFPFNLLAKAGMFFVRKVLGANGEPTMLVYATESDARANRPIPYSGTPLGLGTVAYQLTDVSVVNKDAIIGFNGAVHKKASFTSSGHNTLTVSEEFSHGTAEGLKYITFTNAIHVSPLGVISSLESQDGLLLDGQTAPSAFSPWGVEGTGIKLHGLATDSTQCKVVVDPGIMYLDGRFFLFYDADTDDLTAPFSCTATVKAEGDVVDGIDVPDSMIGTLNLSPQLNIGRRGRWHTVDDNCAVCKGTCMMLRIKHRSSSCVLCQQLFKLDSIPDCLDED